LQDFGIVTETDFHHSIIVCQGRESQPFNFAPGSLFTCRLSLLFFLSFFLCIAEWLEGLIIMVFLFYLIVIANT